MGVLIGYVPIPPKYQHRGVQRNAVALHRKIGGQTKWKDLVTDNVNLQEQLQEVRQLMRESIKNLTVCHKQNGTSSAKF